MAQLGSALDWGSRGRRFKSCQPDWCLCRSETREVVKPRVVRQTRNRALSATPRTRGGDVSERRLDGRWAAGPLRTWERGSRSRFSGLLRTPRPPGMFWSDHLNIGAGRSGGGSRGGESRGGRNLCRACAVPGRDDRSSCGWWMGSVITSFPLMPESRDVPQRAATGAASERKQPPPA